MDFVKKKPHIIIICGVILYAALFIVIMLETSLLPSKVYDNQELLSKKLNSFNKMNYRKSTHDGITTVTCGKMQGMEIIWEYKADEDTTRQLNYSLDVTSGKAKLVLIQPDGTVTTLAESDSTAHESSPTSESGTADNPDETTATAESITELDLKKGKNRIKIVCGKGTSFSLSFAVS